MPENFSDSPSTSADAAATPSGKRAVRRKSGLMQDVLALLIKIFAFLTVLVLVFTFIFGLTTMGDLTMDPAIQGADLILYYRLSNSYTASDVVVLSYDGNLQVRRVIAVAGDIIDITEDGLYINGAFMVEQSQQEILLYEEGVTFPLEVAEGHIFVLADSYRGAVDSRVYGAVPVKDILGKVTTIIRQREI